MSVAKAEVAQAQAAQQESAEERRRALAVALLGLVALAALFFGMFAAGVGGSAPVGVWGVGAVGNQSFWIEAPPGSILRFEAPICNFADSPVSVWARVVEVPGEVRVFAVYINGSYFGVRWGNWSEWRGVLPPGRCVSAEVEVVVDAATPVNKTLRVVASINATKIR
ncbi:hypothetical protein Pogu_0098 [Pyrobaculum oguniense TE7]|uniref:Uncharacterized protein n=1 Tax=Pyrobaculum oguniense (strain DSM 13380 / JCM 10595 / TE7) TaxID=698757 RepID=H6Q6G7_PYROT|nr:hypothetical protein Pogu_0098 [Pyrobaculum oguniense TE7]